MAQVSVAITMVPQSFPAGTVGGDVYVKLLKGTIAVQTKTITPPITSVDFTGVSDDTYTVAVQRWAASGLALVGPEVKSAPFVVSSQVTVDVPGLVSITVTP